MNYDLSDLFTKQAALDQEINERHQVSYETTGKERVLAFLVELGELANETRSFKYWSLKGPSPKDVILEEYSDGLHFIMSLGILLGFDKTKPVVVYEFAEETNVTSALLSVYLSASRLIEDLNLAVYPAVLTRFLGLGKKLGFTYEDVKAGYLKKLAINYERQDRAY